MATIAIQCPDQVLISLKEDAETFRRDLILTAAMKFYELGKLSSGRAADLAGISRVEFIERCAEFKVPAWDMTANELRQDLRHA